MKNIGDKIRKEWGKMKRLDELTKEIDDFDTNKKIKQQLEEKEKEIDFYKKLERAMLKNRKGDDKNV